AIDSVRNQLAGLRRLRAQVALAEKDLSDTIIRAPITGSVTVKHISAAEYLKRGAPVVTLVKLTPLRLRASVPEPYAAAVAVGRELRFTVDAVKGETFRGRVTRISPSVNPETRSLTIEAEIDNRDFKLRPGYFARAKLVVEPNARVVLIPSRAVVRYVGLTRVYVIEDGRAVERSVKLGMEVDGWMEVVEGVRAGEQVITSNLSRVKNGQPVEVESSNDSASRVTGEDRSSVTPDVSMR
ncbi:MAG: efflux RND transporter periplasmic adaptor subunit, partial [Acidobacteria bacterium]